MPSPGSSVPERGAATRVGLAVGGLVLVFGAAFGVGATVGPDRSADARPTAPPHPDAAHPATTHPAATHPDPAHPGPSHADPSSPVEVTP